MQGHEFQDKADAFRCCSQVLRRTLSQIQAKEAQTNPFTLKLLLNNPCVIINAAYELCNFQEAEQVYRQ